MTTQEHGWADVLELDDLLVPLARAGWECVDGVLHAPDRRSGRLIPLWRLSDVSAWPSHDPRRDLEAEQYRTAVRASLHPAYRVAWEKWLVDRVKRSPAEADYEFYRTLRGLVADARGAVRGGVGLKAGTTAIDTAGGALVPAEYVAQMLARVAERAVVRPRAKVVPTNRDRVILPRFQPAAAPADSTFTSGFIADWVGETPSQLDPAFSLGTFEVSVHKLRVRTLVSRDLFDDAPELVSWLTENAAANMAVVEDQAFLTGNGVGRPLGVLAPASGVATVDIAGPTAGNIGATPTNAGSIPKLSDLEASLPDQYTPRATFTMRRATERSVRKLADGAGRPVFPSEMRPDGQRSLLGYAVVASSAMPAEGQAGAKVLLFGDFSGYLIAQRSDMQLTVATEPYGDRDQVLIVLLARLGGAVWNPDAFRIGVV